MAPKITLIYFDFKGRAEAVRLALHVGGVEFEDKRLSREEWGQLKPNTKFGQVPVIHVDGEEYAQSVAILRYAGILGGMYPADPLEALRCDEILMTLEDATTVILPSMRESDEAKKLEMRKNIVDNAWPSLYKGLEKVLEKNGSGFFVGDKCTVADLAAYVQLAWFASGVLDGVPKNYFDQFPKLKELYQKVDTLPEVAAWNQAHNNK